MRNGMDKDKKETLMIASALVTLASGIVMSFLSFFLSIEHHISQSVLWYFAQTLMYAASAFGLYSYVHTQAQKIQHLVNNAAK